MQTLLRQLIRDSAGQDLIEYALLAGFIALASVVMITNIGTGTNSVYGAIAAVFDGSCEVGPEWQISLIELIFIEGLGNHLDIDSRIA